MPLGEPKLPEVDFQFGDSRIDKLRQGFENILEAIEDRRSLATIRGIAESTLNNDSQTVPDET